MAPPTSSDCLPEGIKFPYFCCSKTTIHDGFVGEHRIVYANPEDYSNVQSKPTKMVVNHVPSMLFGINGKALPDFINSLGP